MKNPVLKTERLTLRKPRMSDAEKILYIYQEKYLSSVTHIPYPYKLKDAKDFIKSQINNFGKTDYGFFIILDETKEIIGSLGIMNINKRDNRAEIGYVLAKKHRNNGYMTEACRELVDFGFRKLNLHRININHAKGNKASQRVIKKMGAKYEGLEREGVRAGDGKYKDHLLYAILAKEWKKILKK